MPLSLARSCSGYRLPQGGNDDDYYAGSASKGAATYWVGEQTAQPVAAAGKIPQAPDVIMPGTTLSRPTGKDAGSAPKHTLNKVLISKPHLGGMQDTSPKVGWQYYLGFAQALLMVSPPGSCQSHHFEIGCERSPLSWRHYRSTCAHANSFHACTLAAALMHCIAAQPDSVSIMRRP